MIIFNQIELNHLNLNLIFNQPLEKNQNLTKRNFFISVKEYISHSATQHKGNLALFPMECC